VKPTPRRILVFVIAFAMSLFHMYTAGVRPLPGVQQRAVHLAFVLSLIFLMFPFRKKTDGESGTAIDEYRGIGPFDILLLIINGFIGIYVLLEYENISFRAGSPSLPDSFCSLLAIVMVLEATRRVLGWSMVVICLFCFLYLAIGEHLPLYLAHTGFTFEQIVNYIFYSTEGVMGPALAVSATIIVVYITFGSFLQASGAGPFFMDIGMALFGKFRGGPAKAGIVADTLFGMITGSQVANVGAVGTFTIPLMKEVGYKPVVAAAIEAVGSTGAMIMPPVMGAAAFIIPEFIGGTYFDVVKSAIIPALLFYATLYAVVELQTAKLAIKRIPSSKLPRLSTVFAQRGHMILPLLVLIYFLVVKASSASKAAFWAILACLLVSQIRKSTRMNLKSVIFALEKGAKGSLVVAICCASAGIITGAIGMSGLGERFSDTVIALAGGEKILLLFFTMLVSLLLGLPLPPVTCYLILAVLAAPALIRAGVNPMATHLFIFFFGTLGNISPPVAPTSFTAAGIAGTDPAKTTNLAFFFSLPSWVVPYVFVYSNEILLMGSASLILARVITSFIAICCMAISFQGYLFKPLGWVSRSLFLLAGILLIYPHWGTDLLGYSLLSFIVLFYLKVARRKKSKNSVESPPSL